MNALKAILIIIVSFAVFGCAGYLYASGGVKSKVGYAKLVKPQGDSVDTILAINLGPGGVKPARWFINMIAEDPEHSNDAAEQLIKTVLHELQGVQLRIYDVHNNREIYDDAITESIAALKAKDWQILLTVREDEEHITVMHHGNDEQMMGVSIMVSTNDNAVFVNLIGPFDAQGIAEVVSEL